MTPSREFLKLAGLGAAGSVGARWAAAAAPEGSANVKSFGAKGDGKALDASSVNKAIEAAAAAGGGTVFFPAGNYLCYSVHLKSNVELYLDGGATSVAAGTPEGGVGGYDAAEPNTPWDCRRRSWLPG